MGVIHFCRTLEVCLVFIWPPASGTQILSNCCLKQENLVSIKRYVKCKTKDMLSVEPKGEKNVDFKRPFSSQKLQQSYDSVGGIVRFNYKPLCRKGVRVPPRRSPDTRERRTSSLLKNLVWKFDYSRAPCLGADQKTHGLRGRDW